MDNFDKLGIPYLPEIFIPLRPKFSTAQTAMQQHVVEHGVHDKAASTRKPMWIQEKQRNNRHDLHSTTASRKMTGTECGPLHDLCRPYQSI